MDDKKKRLLIIVLFGVAAIIAALYLFEPASPVPGPTAQAPTAGAATVAPNAAGKPSTPVLPKGANAAAQPLRDVFSPPAGYMAQLPLAAGNVPRVVGGQNFSSAGSAPILTGVIVGEERRVAILRYGTISRSYQVGESAGSYRVVSIGNKSVTLEGPNGTLNLTMGK